MRIDSLGFYYYDLWLWFYDGFYFIHTLVLFYVYWGWDTWDYPRIIISFINKDFQCYSVFWDVMLVSQVSIKELCVLETEMSLACYIDRLPSLLVTVSKDDI